MARGETGLPTEDKTIDGITFRFRKMGSEEGKRFLFALAHSAVPMIEVAKGYTLANWRERLATHLDAAAFGEAVRIFLDRIGEDRALALVAKLEEFTDVRTPNGGFLPLSQQAEMFWPKHWSTLPKFVGAAFLFQFGPFSFAG